MGFHVDPTDYCAGLKVRYDRRILTEFNSRHEMKTRFTFLGLYTGYTLSLQKRFAPFDYIVCAVLHNGTRWSSAQLKEQLFRHPTSAHPEMDPADFRPEVEAQLDYLLTVPANVQEKSMHVRIRGENKKKRKERDRLGGYGFSIFSSFIHSIRCTDIPVLLSLSGRPETLASSALQGIVVGQISEIA